MALRDRILTRPVARALMSPSAILLAGAGASAAILGSAPLPLAAAAGVACYAARVVSAVPRNPTPRIVLEGLVEPWRGFVAEALDARSRYRKAVATAADGPLTDRLAEIGQRLDVAVAECSRVARRGMALESALTELDPPGEVRRRIAEAQASNADARLVASLQSQLDSTARIAKVAAEARDRLRLLDARMDEAVARAVELALRAGDVEDLGGLGSEVDMLVADMEALRLALEETSGGTTTMGVH